MKRLLLHVLFILCSTASFSQGMIEGFVVKKSGDTTRGFIRERFEWSRVDNIEIAATAISETSDIPMSDVDNFYLKNQNSYYFRRTLDMDKKPVETSRLEESPLHDFQTETVVIRRLEEGKVNFYTYVDENGKQHFFIQSGKKSAITELPYLRYFATGGSQIVEYTPYIGNLRNVLRGCDKVRISNNLTYNERPLRKVIAEYNSCFAKPANTTVQPATRKPKSSVSIGVFAGAGVTSENFKGNKLGSNPYGLDANRAKFSNTTTVFAGANIELVPVRLTRFVPGLQLVYSKTGTVTATNEELFSRQDLWMNFSMATTALSLKLIVNPDRKWKLYAKTSIGAQLLLKSTSKFTATDLLFHTKTEEMDFALYKKLGLVYSVGVGTSFDRLALEIDFRQNSFTMKETNLFRKPGPSASLGQAVVSSLAATLGYRLTKK